MTMKNLYIATLILLSALIVACSGSDDISADVPQPSDGGSNKVLTLTTNVSFNGAATTRALTAAGVKTFAVGDKIAVFYTNTSDATIKVESAALTADDIAADGKNARFSVTMTNPKASGAVTYIYPAAMANADGTPKLTALDTQDGTLTTLANTLDYARFEGYLTTDAKLPTIATLVNKLAICKFTIKNSTNTSDITNYVTRFTINDGTNTYTINRTAAAGPIYVAMQPVSNVGFTFTATGTYNFKDKMVSGKTLAANNLYPIDLIMDLDQTLGYTGSQQTLTVPATGYYTLEAWGAQGGSSTNAGGNGGYSKVVYQLTQGTTLYIYCGGAGSARSGTTGGAGGWNGGGKGGNAYTGYNGGGGGGGATHIATSQIGAITANNNLYTGTAANPTAKTGLLLVAGGGGGGTYQSGAGYGGAGGGDTIDDIIGYNAEGGGKYNSSQLTFGGSQGVDGRDYIDANVGQAKGGSGGHGGGFKAVSSVSNQDRSYGGSGGTGWVISTNAYSGSTTAGQRSGNGMARITWYGTTHP